LFNALVGAKDQLLYFDELHGKLFITLATDNLFIGHDVLLYFLLTTLHSFTGHKQFSNLGLIFLAATGKHLNGIWEKGNLERLILPRSLSEYHLYGGC
jgi:hypothetical protein